MVANGLNRPSVFGRRDRRPKSKGFTLIELMIVVAIVAILAAIAYPSYQEQVRKARRGDAKAVLLEAAQWMERYYTANNRYDQDQAGNAVASSFPFTQSPKEGGPPGGYYAVTINTVARNNFTLRANPTGTFTDATCGALRINQTGVKCILDGAKCSNSNVAADRAAVSNCW